MEVSAKLALRRAAFFQRVKLILSKMERGLVPKAVQAQLTVRPPSTTNSMPMMYLASSDATNRGTELRTRHPKRRRFSLSYIAHRGGGPSQDDRPWPLNLIYFWTDCLSLSESAF